MTISKLLAPHAIRSTFVIRQLIFKTVSVSVVTGIALPLLAMTNAHADDSQLVDTTVPPLFMECAALQTDAARLACYDKVALGGESTLVKTKKPLDIVGSVKASISDRRPRVVLADTNKDALTYKTENSDATTSINTISAYSLDDESLSTATKPSSDNSAYLRSEDEILSTVGVTSADIEPYTRLSQNYDLDKNSEHGIWAARPYQPMYVLPIYSSLKRNQTPQTPTQPVFTYTDDEYQPVELKAQISLKTKVMEDVFDTNADLWFGYTQRMYWQVYNEDNSRPFRSLDYMPEIFLTQPVKASLPLDGNLRMLGVGAIHHSNGKSDPLSRSWNRIYLMGGAEWGKLSVVPKIWTHVKSNSSSDPSDNPDITDYYGYGELKVSYDFGKGSLLNATGRYNVDKANGAVEIGYTYPFNNDVNGFLQIFHGYGDSIIDYNEKTTSVGVGVTLSDWQGL